MVVAVLTATLLAFLSVVVYVTVSYTSDESQVGRARADATSNVVVAGRSVHPLVESLDPNWIEKVETA